MKVCNTSSPSTIPGPSPASYSRLFRCRTPAAFFGWCGMTSHLCMCGSVIPAHGICADMKLSCTYEGFAHSNPILRHLSAKHKSSGWFLLATALLLFSLDFSSFKMCRYAHNNQTNFNSAGYIKENVIAVESKHFFFFFPQTLGCRYFRQCVQEADLSSILLNEKITRLLNQ